MTRTPAKLAIVAASALFTLGGWGVLAAAPAAPTGAAAVLAAPLALPAIPPVEQRALPTPSRGQQTPATGGSPAAPAPASPPSSAQRPRPASPAPLARSRSSR